MKSSSNSGTGADKKNSQTEDVTEEHDSSSKKLKQEQVLDPELKQEQ
jgi:hypothetical protein